MSLNYVNAVWPIQILRNIFNDIILLNKLYFDVLPDILKIDILVDADSCNLYLGL